MLVLNILSQYDPMNDNVNQEQKTTNIYKHIKNVGDSRKINIDNFCC